MTAITSQFGTEPRHLVRQDVYDSMIPYHAYSADDIEHLRIELGLVNLTDKQVADALQALFRKHDVITLYRPEVGRVTKGWHVRRSHPH